LNSVAIGDTCASIFCDGVTSVLCSNFGFLNLNKRLFLESCDAVSLWSLLVTDEVGGSTTSVGVASVGDVADKGAFEILRVTLVDWLVSDGGASVTTFGGTVATLQGKEVSFAVGTGFTVFNAVTLGFSNSRFTSGGLVICESFTGGMIFGGCGLGGTSGLVSFTGGGGLVIGTCCFGSRGIVVSETLGGGFGIDIFNEGILGAIGTGILLIDLGNNFVTFSLFKILGKPFPHIFDQNSTMTLRNLQSYAESKEFREVQSCLIMLRFSGESTLKNLK